MSPQTQIKKVGVYDSGVGGLTVLDELLKRFPQHQYFYFGDTAHVPYGSKSVEQIQHLAQAAALKLKSKQLDLLVVACNTVSCVAITAIKSVFDLSPHAVPVVGVVEAGVTAVLSGVARAHKSNILILGTQATIQSHVYRDSISSARPKLTIHEQACPLLVPMIEGGWNDHPVLQMTLEEYIAPYLSLEPGIALLACTHYPWISAQFERVLPGWLILNSASAVADQVSSQLSISGGLSGSVEYEFSDHDVVSEHFILNRLDK